MRRVKKPNRHTIDLIARMVVSGHRGYGPDVDALADLVASAMQNRLEAVGAEGAQRSKQIRRHKRARPVTCPPELFAVLLNRTTKYLASTARAREAHGSAHPR